MKQLEYSGQCGDTPASKVLKRKIKLSNRSCKQTCSYTHFWDIMLGLIVTRFVLLPTSCRMLPTVGGRLHLEFYKSRWGATINNPSLKHPSRCQAIIYITCSTNLKRVMHFISHWSQQTSVQLYLAMYSCCLKYRRANIQIHCCLHFQQVKSQSLFTGLPRVFFLSIQSYLRQ